MTLSVEHRNALYALASNAFADLSRALMISRRENIRKIVDEIISITCRTAATVIERLNQDSSAILRFPSAVLAQIFSWLGTTERVRLTGVSRRFRAVMLAVPSLWSRIDLSHIDLIHDRLSLQRTIHGLSMMIERSAQAKLDIVFGHSVYSDSRSHEIVARLRASMERIRSLHLETCYIIGDLFDTRAPLLESIHADGGWKRPQARPFNIPTPDWVPLLRVIYIHTFSLPETMDAYTCLQRFRGVLKCVRSDHEPSNARRLFQLFPRLEVLHLEGISRDTFMPVGPIPQTMREVNLETFDDGTDLTGFLALFHGHRLHGLTLACSKALSLLVQQMHSSGSYITSLQLQNDAHTILTTEDGAQHVAVDHGPREWASIQSHLGLVKSLSTGIHHLEPMLSAPIELPAVEVISMWWWCSTRSDAPPAYRLRVPRLAVLRFRMDHHHLFQLRVVHAEAVIRSCIHFDGPQTKVPQLVLHGEGSLDWVRDLDLTPFYKFASALYIEEELVWTDSE
ncbi:hypothetical protein EXIGLDRAFT_839757 [Exidia glandulosa HHB12029]|uniref:F-box domain-containing protein n=1 Tax=Exidia glandulosa HHB12029 TaxID=1314781 RepID=A0A165EUL2_EXIGL|nr:hypothetical protein EXIGLDRAFT_839757 [Exidia glandulosa HHB12029]